MRYSLRDYIPYYKRNLRLAGPVMLTSLGVALAGVIDSVMVGHYGTVELAAVSFANSIFFTIMIFGLGCTAGITPLVGYAFVQRDVQRVQRLYRSGLRFTLLVTLALICVLLVFLPIMHHMGQDEQMIQVATPYFLLAIASTLPFLLNNYFKQFFEGLGNTVVAMVVMIVLNLLNIPLNYIFIFGHLGCPALGATGAGIATLIVRSLMPICLYIALRVKRSWSVYRAGEHGDWATTWQVCKLGVPMGVQQVMEILAFTIAVVFVGWLGTAQVAAYQITNNVVDMVFMVAIGIGSATTIRVAHQFGAGRIHDMHMAAHASIHLTLLWCAIGSSIMIIGHRIIPRAFSTDPVVIDLCAQTLVIAGLFEIADGMQVVAGAMLRGISDVRMPAVIAFIAYIAIALPVGYWLMFPMGLGLNGIWMGFAIGLTIAGIMLHIRFLYIAPKE